MIIPFPPKRYQLIYADPAWNWETFSKKGAKKSCTSKYECMTIAEIAALPVKDIAEKDALLFMWATKPLLPRQIAVMSAWGFRYVTVGFTWVKLNKRGVGTFRGCGYYTRANPEMCLIGRRGFPPRPAVHDVDEVVYAPASRA